jgi:uncharacterized protein YbjT (DUF2867 family)
VNLVVGAGGLVGGAVAHGLGAGVRAGLRGGSRHAKAGSLTASGAEVIDVDLTLPESLAPACRGARCVVTGVTSMPTGAGDGLRRVDLEGTLALIDAAEAAGCERFVYISVSGGFDLDSPLIHAKRECERRLASTRMEAVILRPSLFMEVWLGPHLGFDPRNGVAHVPGDGQAPIRFVSAFDVAAFAIAAAAHPSPGGTWEIGGPRAVSPREVVRIVERRLGKPVALVTTPEGELLGAYATVTDPLAKTFMALKIGYARGDEVPEAPASARHFGVTLKTVEEYAATL